MKQIVLCSLLVTMTLSSQAQTEVALTSFRAELPDSSMYLTLSSPHFYPTTFRAIVTNHGTSPQNNLSLDVELNFMNGTNVSSWATTNPISTLAAGATDTIEISEPNWNELVGDYKLVAFISGDSIDANPNNDTLTRIMRFDDCQFGVPYSSSQAGFTVSNLPGNATLPFSVGYTVTLPFDDYVFSSYVYIDSSAVPGELIYSTLFEWDPTSQQFIWIDQTNDYTVTGFENGTWVELFFSGLWSAAHLEQNETYLVTVGHYGGSSDFPIGFDTSIYNPGTIYTIDGGNTLIQDTTWEGTPMILFSTFYHSVEENRLEKIDLQVLGNPILGNAIEVNLQNEAGSAFEVALISSNGQIVYQSSINCASNSETLRINPTEQLAVGTYDLIVRNREKASIEKVVVLK